MTQYERICIGIVLDGVVIAPKHTYHDRHYSPLYGLCLPHQQQMFAIDNRIRKNGLTPTIIKENFAGLEAILEKMRGGKHEKMLDM